jgi:hypothetical protein
LQDTYRRWTPVTAAAQAELFPDDRPVAVAAPAPTLRGSAMFGGDGTLRWEIRRWWVEIPRRWVAWLMLNPSKAGAKQNDPTAQRVTHFSRLWGFDGWIGVNLYPFISSTQPEMWRWADWENNGPDWWARDMLGHNLGVLDEIGRQASLRMVAFGAEPIKRDEVWLEECLEQFDQPSSVGAGEALHCLGVTQAGQPLHPMARGKWRVPDGQRPVLWRPS